MGISQAILAWLYNMCFLVQILSKELSSMKYWFWSCATYCIWQNFKLYRITLCIWTEAWANSVDPVQMQHWTGYTLCHLSKVYDSSTISKMDLLKWMKCLALFYLKLFTGTSSKWNVNETPTMLFLITTDDSQNFNCFMSILIVFQNYF